MHFSHEAHGHGGKRLVHFKQIDVVHRQTGFGQGLASRRHGAGQHDGRVGPGQGRGNNPPAWCQPQGPAFGLAAYQHRSGTIHDAR